MLWRNLQGSGWRNHDRQVSHPGAKFIIPDWRTKSTLAKGCQPARQATLAGGLIRQPCAGVNYIPQSAGTMNLATAAVNTKLFLV
jgi:hypothetical protein